MKNIVASLKWQLPLSFVDMRASLTAAIKVMTDIHSGVCSVGKHCTDCLARGLGWWWWGMPGHDRSDSSVSTAIGHDGEQRLRDGHSASTLHHPVQPRHCVQSKPVTPNVVYSPVSGFVHNIKSDHPNDPNAWMTEMTGYNRKLCIRLAIWYVWLYKGTVK